MLERLEKRPVQPEKLLLEVQDGIDLNLLQHPTIQKAIEFLQKRSSSFAMTIMPFATEMSTITTGCFPKAIVCI